MTFATHRRDGQLRFLARSVAIALAVAAVPVFAAPATQPADLPVKAVTLYTSGVGFFQHSGPVNGDGGVTLKFKTGQINDVIKSLVVQDDGGTIRGVQYPSQDPLDKTLKTFQIDLTGAPTLADLFTQLRGAKVTAETFGDKVHTGTIVGVEKRTTLPTPDRPARETSVLNLFNGAEFSQIELHEVRSIKLEDPTLQAELARALAAVAAGRDQDKKPVTILFAGTGEQRLRLGYVVETPVWKTAYRLLMKDAPAGASGAGSKAATKPADKDWLQGWAVVENQTDADWNDIRLSLVSGRPISFVMDLYQPIYLQRPVVELNLFASLRPQLYQEGMQNQAFADAKDGPGRVGNRAPAAMAMRSDLTKQRLSGVAPQPFRENDSILMAQDSDGDGIADNGLRFAGGGGVASAAITAKLGELFQYTIDHVSLPRQQSSLVPIVTDAVGVEAMSIYNETVLPRNPLTGAMLTNTTGKLLPQGPVTVFNSGGYAGDAQIEDLPAGQKRLLSFGVDLETLVDVKAESLVTLTGGKIVKGILILNQKQWRAKTYAVQNKSDRDKTIVVEHPLQEPWALVDTPQPMEKTDRRYRFKLPVSKGKTEKLKVAEQFTRAEQVQILSADLNAMIYQSKQGSLPAPVRDALVGVIQKRQALADLERQSQEKTAGITAISGEQMRLRENMKVVDKNGQYYARLLTKLNDQESRIETLQKERDELDAKAKSAREELEKLLEGLSVD